MTDTISDKARELLAASVKEPMKSLAIRRHGEKSGHAVSAAQALRAITAALQGQEQALKQACEPWSNYHGDLPDYDHPLRCVYESGIQYAVNLLAKYLDVEHYEVCDGTEEFDGDLGGTLLNIVLAAMPKNADGDPIYPQELRAALQGQEVRLPSFRAAWAKKEAEGYRYGGDALENVAFGYKIATEELAALAHPDLSGRRAVSVGLSCRRRPLDRETDLSFRTGDPGKRVDALVPTPLWKLLTQIAARDGLTFGHAAALALSEYARRNFETAPDPAPEEWTRDLTPEEQKMIDRAWERHKAAGPIDLDELATRFCSAPLPDTVCADRCASMPGYPNRTGTNLLTVAEAREVLARVLADPAPEGEE